MGKATKESNVNNRGLLLLLKMAIFALSIDCFKWLLWKAPWNRRIYSASVLSRKSEGISQITHGSHPQEVTPDEGK